MLLPKLQKTRTTIVVRNGRYIFYQKPFIQYLLSNTIYQIKIYKTFISYKALHTSIEYLHGKNFFTFFSNFHNLRLGSMSSQGQCYQGFVGMVLEEHSLSTRCQGPIVSSLLYPDMTQWLSWVTISALELTIGSILTLLIVKK